jgi:methyl-accepting chemotaxis protein
VVPRETTISVGTWEYDDLAREFDWSREAQDATDEIETLINDVEQHTGHATDSITDTSEDVTEGREATAEASDLLDDIVNSIAETKDVVAEIHAAMEEQADSPRRSPRGSTTEVP